MGKYSDVRASFQNLIGTNGSDIQNAYGMQGDWCMMTVWIAFRNADALDRLADGMKTAWVPSLWDWYDDRGMTGYTPQAGALVFYDYNQNGTPDHIEYCDTVLGGMAITTIAGNTGDCIDVKNPTRSDYYMRSNVLGFAYPDYKEEEIKVEEEKKVEDDTMQFIYRPNMENYMVYYDGNEHHPLHHPDEVTAINMCFKNCFGRDIPIFELGTKEAPWATRFKAGSERLFEKKEATE